MLSLSPVVFLASRHSTAGGKKHRRSQAFCQAIVFCMSRAFFSHKGEEPERGEMVQGRSFRGCTLLKDYYKNINEGKNGCEIHKKAPLQSVF